VVKVVGFRNVVSTACGPNGCFCTLKEEENAAEPQVEESQRDKRGCGEFRDYRWTWWVSETLISQLAVPTDASAL
jgi:hypothetical protein